MDKKQVNNAMRTMLMSAIVIGVSTIWGLSYIFQRPILMPDVTEKGVVGCIPPFIVICVLNIRDEIRRLTRKPKKYEQMTNKERKENVVCLIVSGFYLALYAFGVSYLGYLEIPLYVLLMLMGGMLMCYGIIYAARYNALARTYHWIKDGLPEMREEP